MEDALYLSGIARRVYLVHRRDSLRAMGYLQKDIYNKSNVELVFDSVVEEIAGENVVEKIMVKNVRSGAVRAIDVNGVFVAIGVTPSTDIVRDLLDVDEGGFIVTDEEMKTSSDIVWACGDCRKRPLRQLITAASEGAIAAIAAYRRLKGHYISS